MNTSTPMLRVGDTVQWSPCGSRKSQSAVVSGIEVDCVGQGAGTRVNEVPWSEVHQPGNCIVRLADGRWACGHQIEPLDPLQQVGEAIKARVAKRLKEGGAR